ncbi:leucine-rich repeat domain-containing protein [Chryseobacterium sp. CBSDS_008]|uniref:leucine-rich repeat domain-containing protein n=1 Tax=Chryseobacterium sp. CBSDS_008 TaxID=3415265 RepID=UPI003CE8E4BF
MRSNILNILLFIPLLCSCQQYNSPAYDEKEKVLRDFPIENSTRMVMDSLWNKRDSLTYLRLKNLDLILMNETSTIPSWIGEYEKMRIFKVINEKKKIISIPESIGKLSNLVQFDIPNNQVSILPNSIYNLKNLNYFNLSGNPIISIADKINNLNKLEYLYLDNTLIKSLPETICKLQKIKDIYIKNTKISKLPKCLGDLSNLEWLVISGTQLTEFPIEILNAPKLKTIRANGLKLKNYKEVKAICEKRNITFYYDHE